MTFLNMPLLSCSIYSRSKEDPKDKKVWLFWCRILPATKWHGKENTENFHCSILAFLIMLYIGCRWPYARLRIPKFETLILTLVRIVEWYWLPVDLNKSSIVIFCVKFVQWIVSLFEPRQLFVVIRELLEIDFWKDKGCSSIPFGLRTKKTCRYLTIA